METFAPLSVGRGVSFRREVPCRVPTSPVHLVFFFLSFVFKSMFLLFFAVGVHACPPSARLLPLLTHTRAYLLLLLLAHRPTRFLPFFLLLRSDFPSLRLRLLLLFLPSHQDSRTTCHAPSPLLYFLSPSSKCHGRGILNHQAL